MANTYFRFKQFTVHQDRAAMKVSTDACLFGAWVARIARQCPPVRHALDIGTGTGLLSLLFAQQHPETILDALEIDPAAARQAADNFTASPWSERLTVHTGPAQQFSPDRKYDLVFSNPPFFEKDLRSPVTERNTARHSTTLTLEDLSQLIPPLLSEEGKLAVLLPFHRAGLFTALMKQQGFYTNACLQVKQSPQHGYFRSLLCFSKAPVACQEAEMSIKGADDHYSEPFKELLKDYYLYL